MAAHDIDPAHLDDLVDMLRGDPVDVEASLDPADLNLNPAGVWVSLTGLPTQTRGRLQGTVYAVSLLVITGDAPPSTALDNLATVYNLIRPRIEGLPRNGDVQSVRVTIPGVEGRPMPALSIPVLVYAH